MSDPLDWKSVYRRLQTLKLSYIFFSAIYINVDYSFVDYNSSHFTTIDRLVKRGNGRDLIINVIDYNDDTLTSFRISEMQETLDIT